MADTSEWLLWGFNVIRSRTSTGQIYLFNYQTIRLLPRCQFSVCGHKFSENESNEINFREIPWQILQNGYCAPHNDRGLDN